MSNKNESKDLFFSVYDCNLEESEDVHEILSQTRMSRVEAEFLGSGMQIEYKDSIANKVYWAEESWLDNGQDPIFEINPVSFRDYPINLYKGIVSNKEGKHSLGGKCEPDFKWPLNNTLTPFVYLGNINCLSEKSLEWTKMERFEMVCPIYSDFEIIFLDYSLPNAPELLNPDDIKNIGSAYDDLTGNDEVIFQKLPVSFDGIKMEHYMCNFNGNIGAPTWVQQAIIPNCPKSGKKMKFLLMLDSSNEVQFESSTVKIKDESMRSYLESFNFWGDGCLFIFFEPETKVAAYYIQNT